MFTGIELTPQINIRHCRIEFEFSHHHFAMHTIEFDGIKLFGAWVRKICAQSLRDAQQLSVSTRVAGVTCQCEEIVLHTHAAAAFDCMCARLRIECTFRTLQQPSQKSLAAYFPPESRTRPRWIVNNSGSCGRHSCVYVGKSCVNVCVVFYSISRCNRKSVGRPRTERVHIDVRHFQVKSKRISRFRFFQALCVCLRFLLRFLPSSDRRKKKRQLSHTNARIRVVFASMCSDTYQMKREVFDIG